MCVEVVAFSWWVLAAVDCACFLSVLYTVYFEGKSVECFKMNRFGLS